jgi:1-acyl-sn-glycerol-3-phosphate acyltransferase
MPNLISKFVLYRMFGWKVNVSLPIYDKCIICLAPHTTNWDFILGQLFSRAEGFRSDFLMKSEWFYGPLSKMFRRMGGIPVNRDKKTSLTEQLAEAAERSKTFHLAVTPEGTRQPVDEWKKGFYFIAMKANIPILLFCVDYNNRTITCTKEIRPNGDLEAQMEEIKQYYATVLSTCPENFNLEGVR